MNSLSSKIFLAALTLSSSVLAAAPASDNLSLHEAIEMALKNNPTFRQNVEKVNQADSEVPLARSALYPTLTGVLNAQRDKDASRQNASSNPNASGFNGDPYDQYAASIKLNQTLFQIGSLSAIHAADKDVHISKLNADISRRDLISSTIQAYFQVVLNARNVETLMAQEKIAKESVDVSSRRERTGRGQLLDKLQAQTQLELLQGQLSTAKNNLQIALANLANLLGEQSSGQQYRIPDILTAPNLETIDREMDKKNAHIPELEVADLSIQKISDQRDVLSGENLPTLGLVGSYNFNSYQTSQLFRDDSNSWSVGLQLTIPLFSGFSYRAQDQSLLSQQMQLQLSKKATENLISYQQATNRKNLETAHDSIQTGIEGLKLATASSKEARRNFSLATIDFLQYLSVQQAQVQAEQSLNSYKYNYIVALANYYAASGQDMNHLVEVLEKANP